VPVTTVGIIAPGEMGHAVGARLRARGARVTTSLAGRGERSLARARQAGMEVVTDDADLVRGADLFLSIVPPAGAAGLAERIAEAMRRGGAAPPYVDCNAISPATAEAVGRTIADAGARFIDAGIVGGPPEPDTPGPRFYASGPDVEVFLTLRTFGLDIRPVGPRIGQASALKMSYAALTKGLAALGTELLVAARLAGVSDALAAELAASQPQLTQWLARQLPAFPSKAHRWVAEMQEIADTFASHGLPDATMKGAAAFYDLVAPSPLGRELLERRHPARSIDDVVEVLAAACAPSPRAGRISQDGGR
jgi:3-hydroxyisobutyrate dehydrogenase-like beta-hydroxyacid dehydrogenase